MAKDRSKFSETTRNNKYMVEWVRAIAKRFLRKVEVEKGSVKTL